MTMLHLRNCVLPLSGILTIAKAKGSKSIESFVRTVRQKLNANDINGALAACDQQKGSVANVVKLGPGQVPGNEPQHYHGNRPARAGHPKRNRGKHRPGITHVGKKPRYHLHHRFGIATLTGLLGTVFGMIKAFSALAQAGNPDATALATGISEALINTALGIGTSAIGHYRLQLLHQPD